MPDRLDAPSRLWQIICTSMVPVNLAILIWLLPARFVLGIAGWNTVIFGVIGLPIVAISLVATTLLARGGRSENSRARLPKRVAAVAGVNQITVWAALAIFGATWVDVDDPSTSRTDPEMSGLIAVAGWSEHNLRLSYRLADLSYAAALCAWVLLVVTLVCGRRRANRSAYQSTPYALDSTNPCDP